MRKTARQDKSYDEQYVEPEQIEYPKSTVDNPLMEELHAVSSVSAPAWKTPSVVVVDEKNDSLEGKQSIFAPIETELSNSSGRPMAPSNATILTEKEVKERFYFSDDQLTYRKGMKFGERVVVTLRKIAVWFSDQWDKYVLFMKKHFPFIYEAHDATKFAAIGLVIFFILIAAIIIGLKLNK